MSRGRILGACFAIALALGSGGAIAQAVVGPWHGTTSGAIAIANLDLQIAQRVDAAGAEELLLLRSRFLGDYDALGRAVSITEKQAHTERELLRRAHTRSAVHRFADALADVAEAERIGGRDDRTTALRASILVATGRAGEVIQELEAGVRRRPGFASHSALAAAYAAVGRLADADHCYVEALAALDTTSPFPYAWLYFVRGMMWTEQGGDRGRGEALYRRALEHLPEFASANIHLAELEAARGDLSSAVSRLEPIVASSAEPEALALLGALHQRRVDPVRAAGEIALARERYETLLARYPLAFADHAAEFYLGPGADAERAWSLARQNLEARATERAFRLAIKAARATGRERDACVLAETAAGYERAAPDPARGYLSASSCVSVVAREKLAAHH